MPKEKRYYSQKVGQDNGPENLKESYTYAPHQITMMRFSNIVPWDDTSFFTPVIISKVEFNTDSWLPECTYAHWLKWFDGNISGTLFGKCVMHRFADDSKVTQEVIDFIEKGFDKNGKLGEFDSENLFYYDSKTKEKVFPWREYETLLEI